MLLQHILKKNMAGAAGRVRISRVQTEPQQQQPQTVAPVPPVSSLFAAAPLPEPQNLNTGVIQLDRFQHQPAVTKAPGTVIRQLGYLPQEWIITRIGELLALADTHAFQFCTALEGKLHRSVRITPEIGSGAFSTVTGYDASQNTERLVANFTAPPNDIGHNALAAQLSAKPAAPNADFLGPLTLQSDMLLIPPSVKRGAQAARSAAQRTAFPDQSNIQGQTDPFSSLSSPPPPPGQNVQSLAAGASVLSAAARGGGGAAVASSSGAPVSINPFMSLANQQLPIPSVPITAGDIAQDAMNMDNARPESPRRAQRTMNDAIIATGEAGGVLDALAEANLANAPVVQLPSGHSHAGGPLSAAASHAMVIDPRENIQIQLPRGGVQTIYNPRDGHSMGARMLGRGGTSDADYSLFKTLYGVQHDHVAHRRQQRSEVVSSRQSLFHQEISRLLPGLRNAEEIRWSLLPERLGLLFLTGEAVAGIIDATSAVNTRSMPFTSGRPPSLARQIVTAYDLMTHHNTMPHFVQLVYYFITKSTKLNDVTAANNADTMRYIDDQISLELMRLGQLRFTLDDSVARFGIYDPVVYQQRHQFMAVPRHSDLPTWRSLDAVRSGSGPSVVDYAQADSAYRFVRPAGGRPSADQMDLMRYYRDIYGQVQGADRGGGGGLY
jgi:hypothetical protein